LATVFGMSPRMRFDLMVNTIAYNAVKNGIIQVSGGSNCRPHLHVIDAARAFKLALEYNEIAIGKNLTFNAGSNANNYTVSEVAEMVKRNYPSTKLINLHNDEDKRNYRVSFDKIKNILNFHNNYNVEDGILEMISFLKNKNIEKGDLQYWNHRYLQWKGIDAFNKEGLCV
jgi:nucleoside-diphosphate-sugar epimerase